MSYKKASDVLPDSVLQEVQKYVDGECIYIPRKAGRRLPWGASTSTKKTLTTRNGEIRAKRREGRAVVDLAAEYFLSVKSIYKIINATGKN